MKVSAASVRSNSWSMSMAWLQRSDASKARNFSATLVKFSKVNNKGTTATCKADYGQRNTTASAGSKPGKGCFSDLYVLTNPHPRSRRLRLWRGRAGGPYRLAGVGTK